jgi:hypothetical protein
MAASDRNVLPIVDIGYLFLAIKYEISNEATSVSVKQ